MAKLKKSSYPPNVDVPKGKTGSVAKLSRDKSGNIVAKKDKNFAGVTQQSMKEDAAVRSKTGNRSFTGAPAPRGGKQAVIAKSGAVKGGTKSQVKASKRRVNKSAASPAAKRSAKRLY